MTVARAVETLLPDYSITYFGDIARTPYGNKSSETIVEYSLQNTEFLLEKGAELIIVACNSAASVATARLKSEFKLPILEVITPAVEQAVQLTRSGRIGVIGTRATIRSNIYQQKINRIDGNMNVFSRACPLLVPLVEEDWLNRRETKMIIRRYLHPLKNDQIDTLVLGCTHYPLLKGLIQPRIGKRVRLIDSSTATAAAVKQYIEANPEIVKENSLLPVQHNYYVSDLTDTVEKISRRIFGRKMELIPT